MMKLLYSLSIQVYFGLIKLLCVLGHQKSKDFIVGRKHVFSELKMQTSDLAFSKNKMWCHVSSLGEFEQAKPILKKFKDENQNAVVYLSFFSPSGMNHAKTDGYADVTFYLPKDTPQHASELLDLLQPTLVIFVKYDLWYHYIDHCQRRSIPTLLISAHFRDDHVYFKPWGEFNRSILRKLTHIYTQNVHSIQLLQSINIHNCTPAGDTRIDSVIMTMKFPSRIFDIDAFLDQSRHVIVMGSAWEGDVELMKMAYAELRSRYQLIIAPHDISTHFISEIRQAFSDFNISVLSEENVSQSHDILIVDAIGYLKNLYKHADVSWIGGGFKKSGIHNILEPAVYGNAVFFGPNYNKFPEAIDLIVKGGAVSIVDSQEFVDILNNSSQIFEMGKVCQEYIETHSGATDIIWADIQKFLK